MNTKANLEQRVAPRKVEVRKDANGQSVAFGYAAVFYRTDEPGTQYQLWGEAFERIMPGAFDRMLREKQDVRALYNHDTNCLLGRVSAGTLRLSVDSVGLKYEIDLPDTSAGRDVKAALERGDLKESSFSFDTWTNGKVTWVDETINGESISIRMIQDCDVYDVGPVTFAAYDATTSGVRSADKDTLEQERQRCQSSDDADAIDVRAREVQVETDLD